MDINLFLAIFGIIITIIIGIIGVLYTLKFRNKVKLTFLKQDCISLFKDIVEGLDDIEIKFKDSPIGQNVVFLKGTILNSGNTDIDKNSMFEPLSLILPKNFTWLKISSNKQSENIVLNYHIKDEKTVDFDWDLIKKGEFFQFDALVECKVFNDDKDKVREESDDEDKIKEEKELSGKLYENLKFKHRITNLFEVNKSELEANQKIKKAKRLIPLSLIQFILVLLLLGGYFSTPKDRYEIGYQILENQKFYNAEIVPNDAENLEFIVKDLAINEIITPNDLRNKANIQLTVNKRGYGLLFMIIAVLLTVLVLNAGLLVILYENRKRKNLIKLIEKQDAI
ncbi:hypothetical protein BH10ACI1_BH10ACI1_21800 [soil metagenome]